VNRPRAAYSPAILSLVATLLVSLACGGPRGVGSQAPDLVLLSVDTLRPDHLGAYGYDRDTTPNLDAFFAMGRVYPRAYSTSASTAPSVVSLLTGRLPQDHRVRLLYQLVPDEVEVLTDRLPESYQTAAFVSSIVLTEEAIGLAGRFDHYDDFVDEQESSREIWERSAAGTTDAALAWLREARDPERPVFLWVHYIDPHAPYRPPENWEKRFEGTRTKPVEPNRIKSYMREPDVSNAWSYVDRYDDEVAFTDHHIGRLLAGYGPGLEDALVVFTADVYEAILRVPLMLRGPGVRAGRAARAAHGTDVAPTMLRAAGVAIPDHMPDVDLRGGSGARASRAIRSGSCSCADPARR
jgi:arylsulfatase A-like enzyme